MKKIFVLFTFLFLLSACSNEIKVINKGVDKDEFLAKAQIKENPVGFEMCNSLVQDKCSFTLLNEDNAFAYGFTLECAYPTYTYFSTSDAINDFYPYETIKDGFETTEIRYDRFLSDDPTYEFIQFSTVSIQDYDNKVYVNLNNMCYEWDFSASPYKFIK